MLHVREFKTADELMAHYRALKNKPQPKKLQPPAPLYNQIYLQPIGPIIPCAVRAARVQLAKNPSSRTKAQTIMLEICEEFDIALSDLMSPRRFMDAVLARRKAFWRLKNETTWSLPQIGRFIGKDHTTVLHGIRRFQVDALHVNQGLPMPTSKEFRLFEKCGCRAGEYLAAREQGRAK